MRPVAGCLLAMLTVACDVPQASTPPAAARQILDGAYRAVRVGSEPRGRKLELMAHASVAGPNESFHTRIHSSSEGWVRMEQMPFGLVAGVGPEGEWQADPSTGIVGPLGLPLSFMRGHEVHMLALAPESRLSGSRTLETATFTGRSALAVAMSLPSGDSLVAYFSPIDTLPLGLRVTWTDPHVEVVWSGWTIRNGYRLFEDAVFTQGSDQFRYVFDTLRVGPIPDSIFQPIVER